MQSHATTLLVTVVTLSTTTAPAAAVTQTGTLQTRMPQQTKTTNRNDPSIVYADNGVVKVGVSLTRGGSIAFLVRLCTSSYGGTIRCRDTVDITVCFAMHVTVC